MPYRILFESLLAGLLASLACGLGALPLLSKRFNASRHTGIGYGFAGGLMMAASVYNFDTARPHHVAIKREIITRFARAAWNFLGPHFSLGHG